MWRPVVYPRAQGHRAERPLLVDRSTAADALEQPRRRGRRASRGARRLRRLRQGGPEPRGAARARPLTADIGGRRDAARPERQARWRLSHARVGAARADRELPPRAEVGDVGRVPPARGARPEHVRADDGRQLDLHREPGNPPGHVPDVCRGWGEALRFRGSVRTDDPDRGPWRHGWSSAAGRHPRRGRDPVRRGRPRADSAAPRDPLPGRGVRIARRRACPGPWCGAGGPGAVGRPAGERVRRRARARSARGPVRPHHRPDLGPRSAKRLRAVGTVCRGGGGASCERPARVRSPGAVFDRPPRGGAARVRPTRQLCFRLWQQSTRGGTRGRGSGGVHIPGLRPGLYSAAVLSRDRSVPVGRALGGSGRHRRHRRDAPGAVPGRRRPAALADARAGSRGVPGAPGSHLLARVR